MILSVSPCPRVDLFLVTSTDTFCKGKVPKMKFTISTNQYSYALSHGVKNPLQPGSYQDIAGRRVANLSTGETFSRRAKLNTTKGYVYGSIKQVEKFHKWTRYETRNSASMQAFLDKLSPTQAVMIVVCGTVMIGYSDLEPGDYGCRTVVTARRVKDIKWAKTEAFLSNTFGDIDTYSIVIKP